MVGRPPLRSLGTLSRGPPCEFNLLLFLKSNLTDLTTKLEQPILTRFEDCGRVSYCIRLPRYVYQDVLKRYFTKFVI